MRRHSNGLFSFPVINSQDPIALMDKDKIRERLLSLGVTLSREEFLGADIEEMKALLISKQSKTLPQLLSKP
jgi:hypothetical protein